MSSKKPWESIGYFQDFYCTEKTKEKAKQLVYNYFERNEVNPSDCSFRFERSAWLSGLKSRKQLSMDAHKLTEDMFEKRNQSGIWFAGTKENYVSEEDWAASFDGGM
ncbi:MAG: hypothetical protein PF503_18135 [Desulfobacula sp.]|nr:hypothetical protein [Desulfobacula sp.]